MLKISTIELIKLAQNGDKLSEAQIIEENTGLVHSAIKHFLSCGFEYDDLFQCGQIGLLKAIRGFDASFGNAFSTYAVPVILGEIRKYIRDDGQIKASRHLKEANIKISRAMPRLINKLGREPTISELSLEIGVDIDTIIEAQNACAKTVSLDTPIGDEGSCLENLIGADASESIINSIALRDMLSTLSPKDRQIIVFRFFGDKTQAETARLLNLTQVNVSRREKYILQFLKNNFSND